MENSLERQKELEASLVYAKFEIVKAHKIYNKMLFARIFNSHNLKNIIKWEVFGQKIFRELRDVTKYNHPEMF